jgi:hypothetical protein
MLFNIVNKYYYRIEEKSIQMKFDNCPENLKKVPDNIELKGKVERS